MFDGIPTADLVSDVARSERLKGLFATEIGQDLVAAVTDVAREWLDNAIQNRDVYALAGVEALNALLNKFDLMISTGPAMKAEIIARNLKGTRNGS